MLKETLIAYLFLASFQDAQGNDINDDVLLETSNEEHARLESLEQQTAMLTQKFAQLEKRNQKLEQLLLEGTKTLPKLVLKSTEYSTSGTDEDTVNAQNIANVLNLLDYTDQTLTSKIERLERQVQTDVTSSDKREIQMLQQLMERIEDIEDAIVPTDDVITRDYKIIAGSRQTAFSVAATRTQWGQNAAVTPLILDHVFLNLGGDFNVNNSTFICQVPGYYYFTYTMRSYDGHFISVHLVKNHEFMVGLYSEPGVRNFMDSQSVILELVPGDLIYLVMGASDQYAIHSDGSYYSTFSGFLRYKKND